MAIPHAPATSPHDAAGALVAAVARSPWAPRMLRWLAYLVPVALTSGAAMRAVQLWREVERARSLSAQGRAFERRVSPARARILVLGDSTGVGIGASCPEDSIAGLLAAELPDVDIVNVSRSGARVADALAQARDCRARELHFELALLHVGGNDVIRATPAAKLGADSRMLLAELAAIADQTVWLGPPDVGWCRLSAAALGGRWTAAAAAAARPPRPLCSVMYETCRARRRAQVAAPSSMPSPSASTGCGALTTGAVHFAFGPACSRAARHYRYGSPRSAGLRSASATAWPTEDAASRAPEHRMPARGGTVVIVHLVDGTRSCSSATSFALRRCTRACDRPLGAVARALSRCCRDPRCARREPVASHRPRGGVDSHGCGLSYQDRAASSPPPAGAVPSARKKTRSAGDGRRRCR
jgi:hypothetical protein